MITSAAIVGNRIFRAKKFALVMSVALNVAFVPGKADASLES